MSTKLTIEEMRKLAINYGGKCLSKVYINSQTKLEWQCVNGHQWESLPHNIKKGHWCPTCAGILPLTIEDMQRIAFGHRGKCLSRQYVNTETKLEWQCEKGHQWKAKPSHIKSGHWCPKCGRIISGNKQRGNIEEMYKLAAKRGGVCLSKEYIDSATKLTWQCVDGHQWEAPPSQISSGRWCPICAFSYVSENICRGILELIFKKSFPKKKPKWLVNSRGNLMELDGFNEHLSVAFEYHGKQHFSTVKFFHGDDKRKLHQRISDDLLKRNICKSRGIKLIEIPFDIQVDDFYKYIITQCRKLHIKVPKHTKVNMGEIKSTYRLENLSYMKKLAEQHGGQCISNIYINRKYRLKWQCAKGHQWEASPTNIMSCNWCSKCAHIEVANKQRGNISEIYELALKRGGKCLSKEYVNALSKLRWQCKEGHQWDATPSDIRVGHWCPACAGNIFLTIEEMQKLAEKHSGKCLSKKYINSKTKLSWQCAKDHQWEAIPMNVKRGSWCPICAIEKIKDTKRRKKTKNQL